MTVNLTETGQSRVNGYLFVLERSLKTFLPIDVVRDPLENGRNVLPPEGCVDLLNH